MSLGKVKKQITLNGGMSDDVDDFLIQPPAVEYVENMHWRGVEGHLKKRLGTYTSTATGAPNSLTTPAVLHPIGDKLHTFVAGKGYSYDVEADDWANTDQVRFFTRTSKLSSSQRGSGVVGFDYYYCKDQYAPANDGYAVFAYSQTKALTTVLVIGTDGAVLSRNEILGGFPRIVPGTLGPYVITFLAGTLYSTATVPNAGTVGTPQTIATGVYSQFAEDFTGGVSTYRQDIEDGFPFFQVTSPVDTTEYHTGSKLYLAYTKTNGDMDIVYNAGGYGFQSGNTTMTYATVRDVTYPLAICKHGSADRFYILYNDHGYTYPNSVNGIAIREYSNGETVIGNYNYAGGIDTNVAADTPLPICGAMNVNLDDDSVYTAVYFSGDLGFSWTTSDFTRLSTNNSALSGTPATQDLDGHRPTTNMIYANPTGGTGQMYLGLQMAPLPYTVPPSADTDPPDTFVGWLRPTTNTIVDITTITAARIACAVDTNQSKHCDFTNAGNNSILGSLHFVDDDHLVWTTREVFSFEGVISNYSDVLYTEKQLDADARVNAYQVAFSSTVQYPGVAFGDGIVIPGGATMWFDGEVLSELHPLSAPQIISANDDSTRSVYIAYEPKDSISSSGGTTGHTSNGDWRCVQAVCGYTDARGNIHRSAPSAKTYVWNWVPRARTVESWEQGDGASVDVVLPLSMNPGASGSSRYFVEVYISDSLSGSPRLAAREYYTPNGAAKTIECNQNAYTASGAHADANTKAVVRYTPFVYTTGGVLPADPWPTLTYGVATSTRMFALSAEDSGQVYYSKTFQELTAPEFSAPLVLALGDERRLTAIGKIDDKVVVFEKNAIHVIYGPGPDNTGESGRSGGFDVHQVTSDVGCDQPSSLVEIPAGLVFMSKRGFYLLDRSLQLHYVGGPIQDMSYNATVKSAHIVPEWAEVRFLVANRDAGTYVPEDGPTPAETRPPTPKYANELPQGACLVYNYEFSRWSVFSGYGGEVATLTSDGRFAWIRNDWSIKVEARPEDDHWLDGSSDVSMTVITPPIAVADTIQGYARVRSVTLLGRYLSSFAVASDTRTYAGDVMLTFRYDYEATDADSKLWRANVELIAGADRLQLRAKPGRQKCQSVQLIIQDSGTESFYVGDPTYAKGRGFEISAIEFDIGVKEGPVRTIGALRKA